ncbi:MAG TPA: hypothetical protein ACQGQH_07575 [Xylella sp.]
MQATPTQATAGHASEPELSLSAHLPCFTVDILAPSKKRQAL